MKIFVELGSAAFADTDRHRTTEDPRASSPAASLEQQPVARMQDLIEKIVRVNRMLLQLVHGYRTIMHT
jgi:hypothetical protein